MKATLSRRLQDLHDPRELGGYSRRGSNLLRSMMKDEEAMSKAASSVEVIGEWLKHPHVAQATRVLGEGPGRLESRRHQEDALLSLAVKRRSHDHEPGKMHGKIRRSLRRANHKQGASLPWFELK
ncbi:hypothetical protein Bca101_100776 [Brassica carinata]